MTEYTIKTLRGIETPQGLIVPVEIKRKQFQQGYNQAVRRWHRGCNK